MMVSRASQQGFTLIELMITMTVLAVVLGIGLPALRDTIARNNVVAEANRLVASINFARSQAVSKGQVVTIARVGTTVQNWTQGWSVFTDIGGEGNQAFSSTDGDISLKDFAPNQAQMNILANTSAASWISFNSGGRIISNGSAVTLALCDSDISSAIPGRLVTVSLTGRPSVSVIAVANKATDCTP